MRINAVFRQKPGRVVRVVKENKPLNIKDGEVANVIASGLKQLHAPLVEYNKMFLQFQKRRRQTPLGPLLTSDASHEADATGEAPTTTVTPQPAAASPSSSVI